MKRGPFLAGVATAPLGIRAASAADQPPLKIGVLSAFTTAGSQSTAGLQLETALAVFQKNHGDTIAGRKLEFIKRDTTGPNEDVVKRL
ncbi:MAG TPA: hypothetical protein VN905_14595, partial [Candidatus Binatia bacterium]|nr:hypothetical protein [Candidatus Binatia bacterium]